MSDVHEIATPNGYERFVPESRCLKVEERAELQANLLREERAINDELKAALRRLQKACIESGDLYYASIASDALCLAAARSTASGEVKP